MSQQTRKLILVIMTALLLALMSGCAIQPIPDGAPSFATTESSRARSLLDSLATGQVQLSDNEDALLLAAEQEAYAARQTAQDALAKAKALAPPDPALVAELEAQLAATETAYAQAAAALAQHTASLAALVPGRQQALDLTALQALLDADTTLVSYWTMADKSLAFVVTAQAATTVKLPGVTAQTVLTLTTALYQWPNRENPRPTALRQLYRALIAPLADHLQTPHLAIIPHQSLHDVPFAALADDAHDGQYLGEQYTLSVLPSASVLPFLQQNAAAAQANPTAPALVLGNPATTGPALPYAQHEAEAIAALLHTTAYTGTAATEELIQQQSAGVRVLHLATLYAPNDADPLHSAFLLAPTATHDGRLETHEIFGLPLAGVDLVTLSGSATGRGPLTAGDEQGSPTHAFFFAGAPTVIASLWNVDDAATETLMVSFYKHWLNEGMSKAQALQAAQADVRADPRWLSPFYWAGFVLYGDPGVGR